MCGLPQIVTLTSDNSVFEQVLVFKGTGSELNSCTVVIIFVIIIIIIIIIIIAKRVTQIL